MITWIAGIGVAVVFVLLLKVFKVIAHSTAALTVSKQVMRVLNDASLTDIEKEKAMQKFSLTLLKHFVLILLGSLAALALPTATLWGASTADLLSLDDVITTTLSWQFITASAVLTVLRFVVFKRPQARSVQK